METVNLEVQGMTCGGCVASVKRVLTSLSGVENVDVTLKPGRASVAFDPSRVTVKALRDAIEGAGYDVAG